MLGVYAKRKLKKDPKYFEQHVDIDEVRKHVAKHIQDFDKTLKHIGGHLIEAEKKFAQHIINAPALVSELGMKLGEVLAPAFRDRRTSGGRATRVRAPRLECSEARPDRTSFFALLVWP